ncbi:MAG: nucleotidyltransferase domain-containing protein [bacterium]
MVITKNIDKLKRKSPFPGNIEKAIALLIKVYKPLDIYIFGSYAWGVPDSESDVDFLITVKNSNEKNYLRPIKGLKALKGLNVPKDILVLTSDELRTQLSHPSSIFRKIKDKGIKVYESS